MIRHTSCTIASFSLSIRVRIALFPLNLTCFLAGQFGTRTKVILRLVILASIPCMKLCMLVASLPEYHRACKGRAAITRTAKQMSVKEGLISNEDQTSRDSDSDSDSDRDNSNKDRMFRCRLTTVTFSCRLTIVLFSAVQMQIRGLLKQLKL